jgi:uncharacterized protein DUF3302
MAASHSIDRPGAARTITRAIVALWACALFLFTATDADASLLSPEMEDTVATYIALFVLFIVPVVLIVLFWMVHVLPEKIAHKRHHPQFEAIRTLCLLSLVFGGLLWPLAWIWAYTKPVMHKLAYGTDKDLGSHEGDAWDAGAGGASLRDRLAALEARGIPEAELKALRADLDALESRLAQGEAR